MSKKIEAITFCNASYGWKKKKTKKEGKHIHHLRLEGYAIKQKPQSLKALEALLLAGTLP